MRFLAPTGLIFVCLLSTFIFACGALLNLDRLDLVDVFMQSEALDISAFSRTGAAWIGLSCLVYLTGDFAARIFLTIPSEFPAEINLERAANVTFSINIGLIFVTGVWITLSASQIGGLINLTSLAYFDSLSARDLLLSNKLFTGMRLFYAALPATGCFAAAILAMGNRDLTRRARTLCILTLVINTVALFVLPLVMSQRILLLQFLLSAFLVTCLVRQNLIGMRWLGIAIALFLTSWVLRESVTNPLIHRSALDIGIQKLAFYFVNDLWNGFAPLQADIPHTYGAISLKGVMFLTFTEGTFTQILAPQLTELENVLGGGDFPFFTAAFVDFGPFGGALFIGLCAAIFRSLFHKASQSLFWACVYAQLGAALLFSTHGVYFTHQNFLFSIGILTLIKILTTKAVYRATFHTFGSGRA